MGTPLTDPILSAFSSSVASGRPSTTSMRLMRQFSPEPSSNHSCVKVMLTHGGSVLYCTSQMAENGTQLVQDIQRHSYRYYQLHAIVRRAPSALPWSPCPQTPHTARRMSKKSPRLTAWRPSTDPRVWHSRTITSLTRAARPLSPAPTSTFVR